MEERNEEKRGIVWKIKTDGSKEVWREMTSEEFNRNSRKVFAEVRKELDSNVEIVWVLHKAKRTMMLVDELGGLPARKGYPLPVNKVATQIYHAASRARGLVATAQIRGDVFLFENIDVE